MCCNVVQTVITRCHSIGEGFIILQLPIIASLQVNIMYLLSVSYTHLDGPQGTIKVALKYDSVNKVNAIKKLERVSSPGMRKYTGYKDMPRVINGLGIAIISTSKGVMTNKEAAELKIGGEVLCYVY